MIDRRRGAMVVVVALIALLTGCGSSSDPDAGGSGAPSSAAPSSAAPSSAALTTAPAEERTTPAGLEGFGEVEVRIVEGPDGEPIVICVLVADTPDQRQRGLMEVTDLGGYEGMLFRFPTDSEGGFWMKDTVLPLSIAYLDADGAVVSTADMDPCPDGASCPSYAAAGPYRMALEVEQGGLAPLGLTEGSGARLEVAGPCGSSSG
jgi:uncharacterized membrane protein (UPF0127 family)